MVFDGTTINYLPYMDDIKFHAKSNRNIDSLIHLTRVFSNYIGITFCLRKCGRLIVSRGRINHTDRVAMPDGHIYDIAERLRDTTGIRQ